MEHSGIAPPAVEMVRRLFNVFNGGEGDSKGRTKDATRACGME